VKPQVGRVYISLFVLYILHRLSRLFEVSESVCVTSMWDPVAWLWEYEDRTG